MSDWHVPETTLQAWVAGETGMAASASVEQHLLGCAACRGSVAGMATPEVLTTDLDAAWTEIQERIEPPRLNLVGRVLTRFGMRETDAVLLSAAPALTGAWVSGLALVVLFTIFAASWSPGRGTAFFLVLAPLLPIAGVAAAYGSEADPTHEVALSTPYSKVRLLLLRTGAVAVACVPLSLVAAIPIEGPWWVSVVWLLPALAFVMMTLAAATFVSPSYAAAGISLVWISVTMPALMRREPLELFESTALVVYVVLALVAGVVFVSRLRFLATDWRLG